jgi:hypothetical protein
MAISMDNFEKNEPRIFNKLPNLQFFLQYAEIGLGETERDEFLRTQTGHTHPAHPEKPNIKVVSLQSCKWSQQPSFKSLRIFPELGAQIKGRQRHSWKK